jgi:hypothetical protein
MHGLTARVLLDDEDPEGFEALRQSLWELKKPVGPLEEQILGNVAQMLWRKFRIPGFERDLIQWMETQGEDFATQQAILLRGVAAMDDEEGDDER